jgi:Flp pilus assembly protein TadD
MRFGDFGLRAEEVVISKMRAWARRIAGGLAVLGFSVLSTQAGEAQGQQKSPPAATPPAGASAALASQNASPGASSARAAYDSAFQLTLQNPSDPATLAKFAELAVQVGDIEGSISALERLLLIDGNQPDVKLELGVLYFRLGSVDAARMYLDAARSSSQASSETRQRADTFLQAMATR